MPEKKALIEWARELESISRPTAVTELFHEANSTRREIDAARIDAIAGLVAEYMNNFGQLLNNEETYQRVHAHLPREISRFRERVSFVHDLFALMPVPRVELAQKSLRKVTSRAENLNDFHCESADAWDQVMHSIDLIIGTFLINARLCEDDIRIAFLAETGHTTAVMALKLMQHKALENERRFQKRIVKKNVKLRV